MLVVCVRSNRRVILHCCSILPPGAAHRRARVNPTDRRHAKGQETALRFLLRSVLTRALMKTTRGVVVAAMTVSVHAYI